MAKLNTTESAPKQKKELLKNLSWINEFSDVQGDITEQKGTVGAEDFGALFEQAQKDSGIQEGAVIDGKVVAVGSDDVTVDIGFKCEGFVPLYEFKDATGTAKVAVGDILSVYVERLEIEHGKIHLSKDRADIIKAWD